MTNSPDADCLLPSLLVVEVGHRVAVGGCGGLLAQLGATVVVLEPAAPLAAHKWRHRAAMLAGKESLVIDAHVEADVELRRSLLAAADVVILSTDDGTSDPAPWAAPRPATQVVCDITAFGHAGPLAGRGGDEWVVAALSGVIDTTGPADGPPTVIGAPVLEMSTGAFAASAIVAALRVRRLHGFGQRIDMAVFDTAFNELVNFLPLYFEGRVATRSGNRHPLHVPWGSYRAQDGFVLICSVTADQFARIATAIGQPGLATDERYATSAGRLRDFREIDRCIEAWTGGRTVEACVAALMPLGVACGPILDVEQLPHEPNLVHRSSVRILDDPLTGRQVAIPASPLRGKPLGGLTPSCIPERDAGRARVHALVTARSVPSQALVHGDAASDVRPLAGVRVVEIGQYTVAPLASRHLGALGADAIKVEPPTGDAIRQAAPLRADGLSYIFALSNTDKRGLVLDLRDPAQREMLHRLLDESDILVENLRPGALAKLGLGSAALRARHPRLVYCSINGFGNDSAYPGRPALDTVIQAMSGLMSLTRSSGEPTKAGISASDMLGGEFGLLATLAALEYRDRTGSAVHFDLSMQDSSIWMTQVAWPGSGPAAPVSLVRAGDGYVIAGATTGAAERAAGDAAARDTRDVVVDRLRRAGIPCAPVLTVPEVATSPQVAARRLLVERPTADGDRWTVVGSPLRLLSTPPIVRCAMPRLGSEDAVVIAEFGLDGIPSRDGASAPQPSQETP